MNTNHVANRHNIDVPRRLAYRPKDARGYPIPAIVHIDASGTPQFAINDYAKLHGVLRHRQCGLCGRPLDAVDESRPHGALHCWFVGGPKAFFHPAGAFLDPPVHYECGLYALKVCPYLAAPSYGKRIDDKRMKAWHRDTAILVNEHAIVERPELFVFGCVPGYRVHEAQPGNLVILPDTPWVKLEMFHHGRRLENNEWEPDRANLSIRLKRPVPS